jgi:molecular chaperone DnaJ
MSKKDYYQTLGVSRDASAEEIKRSYRKLAMQFHPDRNKSDPKAEEKFKEASEAYSVLGNAEKRKIYDQYGVDGLRGGAPGGDAGFFSDSVFADFSDILGDFFGLGSVFGRGGRRSGPRQGRDLAQEIDLSMEEAFLGVEKEVGIEHDVSCSTCSGSGCEPGRQPQTCRQCGGSGQVRRQQGFFSISTTCPICNGRGRQITHPCQSCHGSGRMTEKKTLKITFPAGVDSGNRMRVPGEGEGGTPGAPAGDLYLVIQVGEHPHFQRQDNDLIYDLSISFAQAALGDEVRVQTFEGQEKIRIPAETQTGHVLKLKGKGFKNINRWGRGDLLVRLTVRTPRNPSKREQELLRELREIEKGREKPAAEKQAFN